MKRIAGLLSDIVSTSSSEPPERERSTRRILTDADRIVAILEENDGVAWQGELQEETGWSHSKVSRTLSDMEMNGRIRRYQVKREKVVCIPGSEPAHLLERVG